MAKSMNVFLSLSVSSSERSWFCAEHCVGVLAAGMPTMGCARAFQNVPLANFKPKIRAKGH